MSHKETHIPLPDPTRFERAAKEFVDAFRERRGFYILTGLILLAVVSGIILFMNRSPGADNEAFLPLWRRVADVRSQYLKNYSAREQLAELDAYVTDIRGTPYEGLGLWYAGLFNYREAWTPDKATFEEREPYLDRAVKYLGELDSSSKFDALILAKSSWFDAGGTDPIRVLFSQATADLAWAREHAASEPKPSSDTVAVLRTELGDISLQFFKDLAPKHVESFLNLARKGVYNGTAFHFVAGGNADNEAVLGGDPYTFFYPDPMKKDHILRWGHGGLGYDLPPEDARFRIVHRRTIVTSQRVDRADWDNAVQFRIMTRADRSLDGVHTPFAQVVEGMDVVDKVAQR